MHVFNFLITIIIQCGVQCISASIFKDTGAGIDEAFDFGTAVWELIGKNGGTDNDLQLSELTDITGMTSVDLREILIELGDALEMSLGKGNAKSVLMTIERKPDVPTIESFIAEFNRMVQQIDQVYDDISSLIPVVTGLLDSDDTFTTAMSAHVNNGTVNRMINDLHNFVLPNQRRRSFIYTLVTQLQKESESKGTICGTHSQHEYLHSFFMTIVVTEMKAYVINVFAHYHHHVFGLPESKHSKAHLYKEERKLRTDYHARLKRYSSIFIRALKDIPRTFYACDINGVTGKDYISLDGLIHNYQQYILEDSDVPAFPPSCVGDFECQTELKKQRSRIQLCTIFEKKNTIERFVDGCTARYKKSCPVCTHGTSTTRILEWKKCQCYNNFPDSDAIHVVNLRPIESDIDRNMVVTGAKITVQNDVLQFEIQQGKLLEDHVVGDTEWKIMDDISERIYAARLGRTYQDESPDVVQNVDFAVFSIEFNVVKVDEIILPDGYALTGLKFHRTPCGLQLQALGRQFDHETGKLFKGGNAQVFQARNPDRPVIEIPTKANKITNSPTYPVKSTSALIPLREINNVIAPGFDAQEVVSKPPTPLGGVGLMYRTTENWDFIGLLGLKLISINYVAYMVHELKSVDRQSREVLKGHLV